MCQELLLFMFVNLMVSLEDLEEDQRENDYEY